MRHRRLMAIFTFAFTLTLTAGAAEEKPGLAIAFGPRTVTVSGVAAGREIIAFGIGIGSHGHAAILRREVQARLDDDGNGTIEFTVREVPARSVWFAIDSRSGDYVVSTPSGSAPPALALPAHAWQENRAQIDIGVRYLEVLVVRPGGGAWTLRAADGGSNDFDGASDRKVRLSLETMEKLLGDSKGPAHAIARDLVVLVDPQTLETFVSAAK